MTNVEDYSFDFLSGSEAETVAAMTEALRGKSWAEPLLREIPASDDLTRNDKAKLFELRFGYALNQAGIAPHYEIPGEGNSTLDFGFANAGKYWRVELMRLEETDAVRRATELHVDEDGVQRFSQILRTNAEDRRQSPEGETLKAVQRICQKCEHDGSAYKFPVPGDTCQALLVDFRTFAHGGDMYDRIHVGLGGEFVPAQARHFWEDKSVPGLYRLISGVFSPQTTQHGAAFVQERVHFLGFVNERSYEPGAFGSAIQFIANPNLFGNADEVHAALATWPLQPHQLLNGAR